MKMAKELNPTKNFNGIILKKFKFMKAFAK